MRHQLEIVTAQTPSTEAAEFAAAIADKLTYALGLDQESAELHDWFLATALALRDLIVDAWLDADRRAHGRKRVYYLSIEYLTGRLLYDAITNMAMTHPVREALAGFGLDLAQLRKLEPDPALGSGGLGRLAACFMESMASLGIPAYGYGIRYEHGLFRQQIRDGQQQELPDDWLESGNPWQIERPQVAYPIRFGGAVEYVGGDADTARGLWLPSEALNAVAYDTPIVGWRGNQVNTLRLWSARAADSIHLYTFNRKDYAGALAERAGAEAISSALYPNADKPAGQELRLRQEYFFTSASLQDIIQRHLSEQHPIATLSDYVTIQMNDTHPALAVAELVRILVDEHNVSWSEAWRITTATLNYTNHTLLPEAFETWPVDLMNRLLPRHMQIIFLINWRHLQEIDWKAGAHKRDPVTLSLIEENGEKRVRMGHLAFIGSHKINGVSALHTRIMRDTVFKELDDCYPNRIVNKTNGIALRRWLFQANPRLTHLLTELVGKDLLEDASELRKLEHFANDHEVHRQLQKIRLHNKAELCTLVRTQTGLRPTSGALFDVHIKRIHEYKRQLLNILEAVALFHSIHADPNKIGRRESRFSLARRQ